MMDFGFYNMDCMEGMKEFPDDFFDLAIVDPPYGIGADKFNNGAGYSNHAPGSTAKSVKKNRLNAGGGKLKERILNQSDCSWDAEPPKKDFFEELFRVSKIQVIWGGNYFDLPPTRGIICWDKQQPWENFSQFEYAWTNTDRPAAMFRYDKTAEKGKIHPTQKPLALYMWLLGRYAKRGDRILDPMAGSGTTLIACRHMGYDCVAFERDDFYYKQAKERLDRETAQMNIYDFLEG